MPPRIDLTTRFEQSWQEWNDALAGLRSADFQAPVYPHWTIKDILGYVDADLELDLRHVLSYKKRRKLASPRAPSYSYFNRREAARLRPVPVAELRREMKSCYRELMKCLPTLTDEDMKKKFPSQWSNSKYTTTLRGLLLEEASHMHIHAGDVRKWRIAQHAGK